MNILIKNGKVIDPVSGVKSKKDLLIEKDKIVKVSNLINRKAVTVIDAAGKIVVPGFVDMHSHLREPGREDIETMETGLRAAVAGGFTTVCAMPNTEPPCDTQADVMFLVERAKEVRLARVLPIGTITKGRKGDEISELGELKNAGCPAISDDGDSVSDSSLLRRCMEYASMLDLLVISHCEDKSLAGDGVMHEGYWSTVLGLEPIPAASESMIVERDIRMAELTGARLHIAHISKKESVDMVRAAKKRGVKVTAEVTPHHFTLTDEDLKGYDTNMKVNPPIGGEDDRAALRKGLKDGTIDVIATDHAPHLINEKEKEFDYAPFGMIGFETALSLGVVSLIEGNVLDWTGIVTKMSVNPSSILGEGQGSLAEGATADITIIDPAAEWQYTPDMMNTRSTNSPFTGWQLKSRVTDVMVSGRMVVRDGKIV